MAACGCTTDTLCAAARDIRDEFLAFRLFTVLIRPESQAHRRRLVAAYTAHRHQAGLLADGTEVWPMGYQG